jgi:hypothetical protein
MSNKIKYPIVGGIVKNMKGYAGCTNGANIKVSADNTVAAADGVIHGIALDAPKSNVSPSTSYTVSVLLFGACVMVVADTMAGAVAGNFLKCTGGALVLDGAAKTADSVALLLDAANKVILIL